MPMFHFYTHFYTEIEHWTAKWVNACFTDPKYRKIKKKKILHRFSNQVELQLRVQLCKIYNDKYMIASTQITNTEVFAVIAALVF